MDSLIRDAILEAVPADGSTIGNQKLVETIATKLAADFGKARLRHRFLKTARH